MVNVTKTTTESEKLVGNPQITHFKAVYRRHSNFLIEQKIQQPNNAESVSEFTSIYNIDTSGHLLTKCWIEVTLTPNQNGAIESEYINWTNNTGHALIKEVELKVSNNLIDKHTGVWLDVYNELNDIAESEHLGLNKHVCKNSYLKSNTHVLKPINLVIPLKFFFNTNPGLALPLVSLYKGKVQFKVTYRDQNHLINIAQENYSHQNGNALTRPNINFFTEIIHLDTPEAARFKQNRHEYLIEVVHELNQLQFSNRVELQFSHPVKELIWIISHPERQVGSRPINLNASLVDATLNRSYNSKGTGTSFATANNQNLAHLNQLVAQKNDFFEYSCGALGATAPNPNFANTGNGASNMYGYNTDGCDWFDTALFEINGDKFSDPLKASYLRTTHPHERGHKVPNKHVYCYSFALNPGEYSPSGIINCSDSSNQYLHFTNPILADNSNSKITVFAVQYNIFRVFAGNGSLVFSQ